MLTVSALLALASGGTAIGQQPAESTAAAPCLQAEALLDLGRVAAAEKAFEKDLGEKEGQTCAAAGLARIAGEAGMAECAAADALREADLDDDAKKVYLVVLDRRPDSACATSGLTAIGSEGSLVNALATFSEDALDVLVAIAIGGLILAAAWLALLRLLARFKRTRDWGPVGRYRRPTVTVESFGDAALGDKVGAATAALLKSRLETGPPGGGLKIVSGAATTEEKWIERFADMGDQAKAFAALVALLRDALPRRHVKVSGEIQPPASTGGAGISVEAHRGDESAASIVFWADDFRLSDENADAKEAIRRLTVPAAAWVSHVATRQTEGETVGASDPFSWALFRAGLDWHRRGSLEKAYRLYDDAWTRDRTNYGALANLALIEGGLGARVRAVTKLREALLILEPQ